MSQKEIEAAINSLCLIGQFGTLYRILKPFPGAFEILTSDRPSEQKRRELLRLLKGQSGKEHGIKYN